MFASIIPYSHAYLEAQAIEKFRDIAKSMEQLFFITVQKIVVEAIENYYWGMHNRFANVFDSHLIAQIKERYLQDKRVLEIGCGFLQSSESYLFNQFKPQVNWTLSDHAISKSRQMHSNIEPFNLEDGSAFKQKYPVIIGCNTLDTIPAAQLDSSIKAIHDTLEFEGVGDYPTHVFVDRKRA